MRLPPLKAKVREHARSTLQLLILAVAVWLSLALQDLLFAGSGP